uniref:PX domain-containing protein n=1 Tax=Anopheles atroparvus TaxID=41427 RepID=A0AAG5DIX2_ANOAO
MPVIVETNFLQSPTASLLTASPPGPAVVAAMAPGSPEAASIALLEVSSTSAAAGGQVFPAGREPPTAGAPACVGDSTFINGAGGGSNGGSNSTATAVHSVLPWNGTQQSRSPSLGDTFVSAAASSDLPYPSSSFTDSSDDSDTGPEGEGEEDAEMLDVSVTRSALGYITTATITLSGSHNSLDAKAAIGNGQNVRGNSFPDNGNAPVVPAVSAVPVPPGTLLPPGHAPSPSGSTSISLSIGSIGEDSTVRELNEPHISVKIVPEKKGLFLKHSEYEIKLKGTEKPVRRRYKDFVTLLGYLAEKYPYRLLPSLPPKQLMLDSLLEERRRGLQTWLTIVSLHPVLGPSPIVGTFLRDTTTDYQYRMRVAYEKQMDEYARLRPDVTLPREDVDALAEARTRLCRVKGGIGRLRELFEEQTDRTEQQLTERTEIEHILQSVDLREAFAEGTFEDMSAGVRLATRQCERYVRVQQRAVTERLHVLLEVLHAHSTLCERIEKGIFAEHQKALLKTASSGVSGHGRAKTLTTATPNHGSLIMPSEGCVSPSDPTLVARRSAFAFSCARSETELAERYLHSLPSILLSYAHEEQQHHQQMSKIWHRLVVNESGRLS